MGQEREGFLDRRRVCWPVPDVSKGCGKIKESLSVAIKLPGRRAAEYYGATDTSFAESGVRCARKDNFPGASTAWLRAHKLCLNIRLLSIHLSGS